MLNLKMRIFTLSYPSVCINVKMFAFYCITVCCEYEFSTVASIVYDIRNLYSMGFSVVHSCMWLEPL